MKDLAVEHSYAGKDIKIFKTARSIAWTRTRTHFVSIISLYTQVIIPDGLPGATIRPFGLTVNDRGLFLRIPEIEAYDKKRSLVLLTTNPTLVLKFLGLEEGRWWKKFDNQQEMFEYASSTRYFWIKNIQGNMPDETGIGRTTGQESDKIEKERLKNNDRKRMAKRPVFAAWTDEFIPKCQQEGKQANAKVTRDSNREEAFKEFGVKEEYEKTLKDWILVKHK